MEEVKNLLGDYHMTELTTLQLAQKYDISREEVLLWLEKEANGDLDYLY